jgi:glycosyltransferase involved in cell wall biosynthesis/imidazolonepropionase-like amidohydrolase
VPSGPVESATGARPRVLFMASTLSVGGAEIHLLQLVDGLRSKGFEPHVVILKTPGVVGDLLIAAGACVTHDLKKWGVTPGLVLRLYHLIRTLRPVAVLTLEHDDVMLVGRLAARLARVPRIITTMHTTDRADRSSSVPKLFRLMRHFSDVYVAATPGHRDYLAAAGLPADRIRVIRYGVDLNLFRPAPRDPECIESLGLPRTGLALGMVASFRPEKNHDLALAAFQLVRERLPSAHLLLVGDGPLRIAVESRVRLLGLEEAVHFCGLRHDLERILPQLDLVLLTSAPRVETVPITILDAMACGRAVVATDVGCLSEVIDDGISGVLVRNASPAALAAAATDLLLDDRGRARIGAAARARVEAQFSLPRMLRDYRALLGEGLVRMMAWLLIACAGLPPAIAGGADLLIRNAALIDATGAPPRAPVDLLVRDERIAAIGEDLPIGTSRVIDASGMTVLPGLTDSHVHFLFAPGSGFRGDSAETIRRLNRIHLRAYLACGVTTVLDAGTTLEGAKEIQQWLDAGGPGPRYLTTGPYVRPPGGYGYDGFGAESKAEDVEAKLEALQSLGAAGIKLAIEAGFPEFSQEMREVVRRSAQRRNLPLYIHATSEKAQAAALDLGAHAIMHAAMGGSWRGDVFGARDLSPGFVRRMAESRVYQLTTFSVIDNWPGLFAIDRLDDPLVLLAVPEVERASARDLQAYRYFADTIFQLVGFWTPRFARPWLARLAWGKDDLEEGLRYSQRNIRRLHEVGVPIVVATDAPSPWPASSSHFHGPTTAREIELLVEAGLEPLAAIAAATRNPAEMLRVSDEIGTVVVGKRADLVIVEGDPSVDPSALRRVRWTLKGGVARTPQQWMSAEPER